MSNWAAGISVNKCSGMVPSRGVVVVLGLATVAMWHSSPGPTLLLPEQLCLQTTHPFARDREPWKLGGPQHHRPPPATTPQCGSCFFLCLTVSQQFLPHATRKHLKSLAQLLLADQSSTRWSRQQYAWQEQEQFPPSRSLNVGFRSCLNQCHSHGLPVGTAKTHWHRSHHNCPSQENAFDITTIHPFERISDGWRHVPYLRDFQWNFNGLFRNLSWICFG